MAQICKKNFIYCSKKAWISLFYEIEKHSKTTKMSVGVITCNYSKCNQRLKVNKNPTLFQNYLFKLSHKDMAEAYYNLHGACLLMMRYLLT